MPITYKKYDDHIKEMVIRSGNPNSFPELNIPRTTALYWIKKSKRKIKSQSITLHSALNKKIFELENEIKHERSKNVFIVELLSKLEGIKDLYAKDKNKIIIVNKIKKFSKWSSAESLCRLINLKSSKYYCYKKEVIGCERIGLKKCKIQSGNQLTFKEQETIYDLLHDKTLSHLSIKKLQYYAFRKNLVICGYDTWRKYTKTFMPNRARQAKRRKKYRIGIRAKKINEIWHMDITEFRLHSGGKIYLQVVVDNFSRKVIAWKLSQNKNESLSLKTILSAIAKHCPTNIMTDGGGENVGIKLKKLYMSKRINPLIAKQDISYTNSMVESFFCILKNRFINKNKPYKLSKIHRLIRRSIKSYNHLAMPIFHGATPSEIYTSVVSPKQLQMSFKRKQEAVLKSRVRINRLCHNGRSC